MIAVSSRPTRRSLNTVSFASTLYLMPILDLLLTEIPTHWQQEVRLGLQEALVNAAKHGNKLDPTKTVLVQFFSSASHYWWVISDQGPGFEPPRSCHSSLGQFTPCEEQECGRGLYILYQIFDQVQWNHRGTELRLCKRVENTARLPFLS